jgi:hypothetical protein
VIIIIMALQPFLGPWPFFSFLILYTVGRTPWTEDRSVSRPLPTPEEHKHGINARNTDIHALSEIRTQDPSVRASEDSSCLRPHGHCDRLLVDYIGEICSYT